MRVAIFLYKYNIFFTLHVVDTSFFCFRFYSGTCGGSYLWVSVYNVCIDTYIYIVQWLCVQFVFYVVDDDEVEKSNTKNT